MKTDEDNSLTSIQYNYKNDFLSQLEVETSPYKKYRYNNISFFNKVINTIYNNISNLLFLWVIPTLKKANDISKPLKVHSLTEISPYLSAKIFFSEILPFWKQNSKYNKNKNDFPLFRSIIQSNACSIIIILVLAISKSILSLSTVFLFRQTLLCFNTKPKELPIFSLSHTVFLLLLVKISSIFVSRKTDFLTQMQGAKTTVQINCLIYDKLLKMSNYKDNFSEGQLVNFIQTDSEKFAEFLANSPSTFILPFQILFYFFLLFKYFGFSFLFGMIFLLLVLILLSFVQKMKIKYQKDIMKLKDERMRITTNVFNMIKFLKLCSWEEKFKEKILEKRKNELNKFKEIQNINLLLNSAYGCSSTLVSVISITIYNLFNHHMDLNDILTAIYIFNSMTDPLFTLPGFFNGLFDTFISLRRIENFLSIDSNNSSQIYHLPLMSETSIQIEHLDFGFKSQNVTLLKDINLTIKKGSFIGVFGEVGSGKSNLIHAIMNNYDIVGTKTHSSNRIKIAGNIAYVPQNPWIINDTLRNNILFFKEMDEERYKEIISLCELEEDIKCLNGGDMAELGEKGLNLSGGQKARIALARALYSNADIYLLDDPLSAVDAFVGNKLFTKVMKKYLNGKTRILVTHATQIIDELDGLIVMKNGTIDTFDTIDNIKKTKLYQNVFCTTLANGIDINNDKKSSDTVTTAESIGTGGDVVLNIEEIAMNTNENSSLTIDVGQKKDIARTTKDEIVQSGKVKLQIWIKYFNYIGGFWFLFLILLSNVLWKVCEVGSDYFLSYWTEKENLTHKNNSKYLRYYTLLTLLSSLFVFARSYLASTSVISYNKKMHDILLTKLLQAPINLFHDTIPRGQILNRLSKDLDKSTRLCWSTTSLCRIIFQLISSILICFMVNWQCLLILPFLIFVEIKIMQFYLNGGRSLNRLEGTSRSPIISVFSETIPGINTIRACNLEEKFKEKYYSKLNNFYKILLYQSGSTSWFGLTLNLISFILLLVILLFAIIFKKTISPQSMGLLLSYSMKLNDYLYSLLSRVSKIEKHITSVERCDSFTEIVQEREYTSMNDRGLVSTFGKQGKISFIHYSNRYRFETPIILNDISLTINPGEKVGVVGRTGSGKSTLCLSLFRIIEASKGKILIDDIDISTIGLKLLRENITIIPQEPCLFEGTLKENVDPLCEYTEIVIRDTLSRVGLNYLDNLNMEIEENGSNLSIGEKQLLCFARAILRKHKIVVMDEATASMDYQTEHNIQRIINEELKDCTVITIAHRINTVINYDKIIVLDKGCLMEYGPPEELLQNEKGEFYQLYMQSQMHSKK